MPKSKLCFCGHAGRFHLVRGNFKTFPCTREECRCIDFKTQRSGKRPGAGKEQKQTNKP